MNRPMTFPLKPWPRFAAPLGASFTMGLLLGFVDSARAQEAPLRDPATVAEAARVLNLETFPIPEGARPSGPRRVANLSYNTTAGVKEAYETAKQALAARGWAELPNAYVTAESASGTFTKDNALASVSAFSVKPGDVTVSINQHGNVDLAQLPVPPDAKPTYSGPVVAMFVTAAPRDATAKACRELLVNQGWQPYGTAGDSLVFKRNAVRLNAMISTAPAQGGKTAIQYSAELMSADLPVPSYADRVQYADTTKALSFDVKATSEVLVEFYRTVLGQAGWKPTTERTIKTRQDEMLIFRNPGGEMLTLEFFPHEGMLRGKLEHLSAAEVAEQDRLAKAAAERAKMANRKTTRAKPVVPIALPAEAEDVEEKGGGIGFTVATGKAKAAVEQLRDTLRQDGWKEDVAVLEALAGAVSLSRPSGGSLTINYTDTGVMPADVSISAIGVTLKRSGGAK